MVAVLAFCSVLMTFAPLRTFGASLLASAGVIGVIGALAAQSTLGNVFAGLQIAFTDTLRLDDAVVVQGQLREDLLRFIQVHHPEGLPVLRMERAHHDTWSHDRLMALTQ